MIKVLYVGYAINKDDCNKQLGASVAGNNMQLGILKGINNDNDINLEIMTINQIASFPKVRNKYIKNKIIELDSNMYSKGISFINIPFIKQITQGISVFNFIRKEIKKCNKIKILTFNNQPIIGLPINILKKFYKFEATCILADPPVNLEKNKIIYFFRNIENFIVKKTLLQYEKMIILNKGVLEYYNITNNYLIIDGGFSKENFNFEFNEEYKVDKNTIRIVFTGAITEYNGLKILIDSMNFIKLKNIELVICGDGDVSLINYIQYLAKKDRRINYIGKVSNKDAIKIQKEASFLINPRIKNDFISKVTFPSKMIEYMLSKKPVLSTDLNGLTKDYLKFLNIIDTSSPKKLAEDIEYHIQLDYNALLKKADRGFRMIYKEKCWEKQSKKICDFLRKSLR